MKAPVRNRWRQAARWWWYDYEWPVVGALALAAVALGGYGFSLYFAGQDRPVEFLDVLFKSIQLFVLETDVDPPLPWQLNTARFLAPIIAAYTAIQALAQLFAGQIGSLQLRLRRQHIIIGGLGRKAWVLVRGLLQRGQSVVVIEQDAENDLVSQCRDLGGIVLIGDATEPWLLRKAGIARAGHLFALCGNDGVNAQIAVRAAGLLVPRSGSTLTCVVHLFDPELCALLRECELDTRANGMRLEFFNTYDLGARILLEENPLPAYPRTTPAANPHLVIVGLGRLGESLLIHAARQWHIQRANDAPRLRAVLVDRNASSLTDKLRLRYPALARSCELVPFDLDVHSAAFQQADYLEAPDPAGPLRPIFICLGDDSLGLSAALELAAIGPERRAMIVVCMEEESGLAVLLHGLDTGTGSFRNLRAFGILDRTCHPDQVLRGTHEILARAIHEEYLRQQAAAGVTPEQNPSMVPWNSLPEHLKQSNRQQADDIRNKLQAVGCGVAPLLDWDQPLFTFQPPEIERLARLEHERWMTAKLEDGWKLGRAKDANAKTHPCLVAYDQLPPEEQEKDRHAVRQIPATLAQVGFRVQRFKTALKPATHPHHP